jgi:hypothetical protein
MKVDAKHAEPVPLAHEFAIGTWIGIFRNERTRSTPVDPKLIFWDVSHHFVTARKSVQNAPNLCYWGTSSIKQLASEFFATNAPDPLHWTQNSCFEPFRTVSLLHESRCKMGRTVPLTHKFAKWSWVRIFHNECNWSTPLDPKLMFWDVSHCFVTIQKSSQKGRTSAINAQVHYTQLHHIVGARCSKITEVTPTKDVEKPSQCKALVWACPSWSQKIFGNSAIWSKNSNGEIEGFQQMGE